MALLDPVRRALSFVLGWVVPKDPRVCVFAGRHWGGNTAPLFEAAASAGLAGHWLTRRPEEARGPGRASTRSWRALWLAARAGTVVLTHSLADLAPLSVPRARIFNVWHGMPIKRIAAADPGFATRRHAAANRREQRRYAGMFATSRAMAELFTKTFGLPAERIFVTGQPRTDVLARPLAPEIEAVLTRDRPSHRRRILYCPTWREHAPVRLFPFADRDLPALDAKLAALDAVMFVRTHPNDPGGRFEATERIVGLPGSVLEEITDALPAFAVLVTDYSSVWYDWLLLDRPALFLPYDLAEYTASPGFYRPFDEIAAGPRPVSQAELVTALAAALEGEDPWADARARVRALVHEVPAHGATERVLRVLADAPARVG